MSKQLLLLRELNKFNKTLNLVSQIKVLKKEYRRAINGAKVTANERLLSNVNNPTKALWNIVNSARKDPTFTTDKNITAEEFHQYFNTPVVSQISSQLV